MSYRDSLPEGCPPSAAETICAKRVVFRLVKTNPPTVEDFLSKRQENPNQVFRNATECEARGISVFSEKRDVEANALKLPSLKNRKICRVALSAGSGCIQRTFNASHHTWWPLAEFDILANCEVETA
jgi:hypothetical protein